MIDDLICDDGFIIHFRIAVKEAFGKTIHSVGASVFSAVYGSVRLRHL